MIRVAIVEDEMIVAEHLENILINNQYLPIALAQNIAEAKEAISEKPDLFLLDIRLADEDNGIDFGAFLKEKNIPFIYITANNELEVMRKAIQTQPATYITKPFKESDVLAALELVKIKLSSERFVSIIGSRGEEKLAENDILYVQADGVYSIIYCEDDKITQRINLKELELKLSDQFIRIHRSYLVNKEKVTSKKASSVFINQIELPVSRSYKKEF
ncbi:MAG: response regulator transcription factor [Crocinitomicaceae bacterium]